jgi:transcriptional regulator with XRE-family HTH domain
MIVERLKKLRNEKGLLQKELASSLGISPVRYNLYEKGKREPDHATLTTIARELETSSDYLLGNTDDPRPPGALLVIPKELEGVKIAAHHGEEDWTQEEIDAAAAFVRFMREQKKQG